MHVSRSIHALLLIAAAVPSVARAQAVSNPPDRPRASRIPRTCGFTFVRQDIERIQIFPSLARPWKVTRTKRSVILF